MWTDDYVLAYRKRQAKNHAILGTVPYCLCTLYLVYQGLFQYCLLLGLFQKLSSGGWGRRHFFVCGGRVFCWQCVRGVRDLSDHPVRGVGGGLTCPGGQGVFDLWWGVSWGWGTWFTELSWGSGSSDSMCVLGVEGSEKKCAPPRIISETALRCRTIEVQVFLLNSLLSSIPVLFSVGSVVAIVIVRYTDYESTDSTLVNFFFSAKSSARWFVQKVFCLVPDNEMVTPLISVYQSCIIDHVKRYG